MAAARIGRSQERGDAASAAEAQAQALALIERQVDSLAHMAQSFAAFAKLPEPVLRPVALRPLISEVGTLYRHMSPVPIEVDVPVDVVVPADPELLSRALGNLVKNAIEASTNGGPAIRVTAVIAAGQVRVEIADGGCGIRGTLEGPVLARSLATTKAAGSGLGLPVAHKIIHEHGGTLRLEPRPEGGTLATVLLYMVSEVREVRAPRLSTGKA
jgi:two-component system, NtrC family, nitrogen regulation sensor histidine kinase NtrY